MNVPSVSVVLDLCLAIVKVQNNFSKLSKIVFAPYSSVRYTLGMMTRTELLSVIEEANNNSPEWIRIFLSGTSDRVIVEGSYSARPEDENNNRETVKVAILAAKTALGQMLQARFPERTFLHSKSNGYKLWPTGMWNYGVFHKDGIACGIKIKLSDDEHRLILLGAAKRLFT